MKTVHSKLNIAVNSLSLNKSNLPFLVKNLLNYLSTCDFEIYLIGGFVRDLILQKSSFDLDFLIVDKDPVETGKQLANKFDGHSFLLDKETKTVRVVLNDENARNYTFDFTSVIKSKLEEDFLRRDFTINALAIDLKNPDKLIDKFSGLNDLQEKKIKAIKTDNLSDDPLRFLRAFRFAAIFSGVIEEETLTFISNNLSSFNEKVSNERVSVELWRMLDSDNSYKYVRKMADIGLLEKIIPELTPCRKVTPNIFHHLWLFDHSIELIRTFEENFHKIPDWAKDELNKPFGSLLSPTKKSVTKLASLLHDIGKPVTWEIKQVDGNEKHTFYGHDKLGAQIVKEVGERLKFSNSIIDFLSKLVNYHLRPFQLSQGNAPITDRALYRFFRDLGEDTPSLLMLAFSDLYATVGPKVTKEDLSNGEKLLLFLFEKYKDHIDIKKEKAKKPKLLDGNEIMQLTGMKPSKKLGDIIKELDEVIGIGEITTKEEAKNWIKQKYNCTA